MAKRCSGAAGARDIHDIGWDTNSLTDVEHFFRATEEYGRMKKRIEILEDGRVAASRESGWKIAGETATQVTRKKYGRLRVFQDGGLMAQKRALDEKTRGERRELPKKVRDEVRESEAMMEEKFCDKYRSGVVKERVICTEEDTGSDLQWSFEQ